MEIGLPQAQNYIHQGANVFTLETDKGRQRFAKGIATMIAILSHSMVKHGNLPEPGHSSTEDLQEWEPEDWTYNLREIDSAVESLALAPPEMVLFHLRRLAAARDRIREAIGE